ncbi:MAG TPA: precorrin-4 C(11)-methyltransferase [Syntrophomonadaceae bacterium]|jgi:precorrin-4/cobalt-precorrin-4 C11-methyltransferase|nr:precorrin-4 C(11)-methyltransferase [Syntrophomonadaceae bacterium]
MIYFVGAGPGDPELITLKAYRLLQQADLLIYTGSLINPALLDYCSPACERVNSAFLDLEQILKLMIEAYYDGRRVVRLHTGDPSLYGAIGEQMEGLKKEGIPFGVVPGVSSFLAAAASLEREYTVPELTQTLIITRMEGRTPVPEGERLSRLAMIGSSMVIFLSVGMIEAVAAELAQGYPPDTPVAVVERVSWPDERILQGTLAELVEMTRAGGIKKTALIMVGDFLCESGRSRLYDKDFAHEFRE